MKTISNKSLGLKIILDENEIFPNDPGMGTPIIIEKTEEYKKYTATWNCGTETDELDGYSLTDEEKDWIESKSEQVMKWARENHV